MLIVRSKTIVKVKVRLNHYGSRDQREVGSHPLCGYGGRSLLWEEALGALGERSFIESWMIEDTKILHCSLAYKVMTEERSAWLLTGQETSPATRLLKRLA